MNVRREGMPEVDEAFKVEALLEVDWPRLHILFTYLPSVEKVQAARALAVARQVPT